MLDRIRRKLFLSLKVMSSSTIHASSDGKESEENAQQLKKAELMDILRKGSSAISREDTGMDFGSFLNAPIDSILDESRAREGVRDARMKKDLSTGGEGGMDESDVKAEETEKLLQDAEEEERRLLSGVAQVQSRLFEGQVVHRRQNNQQIAQEWEELQKRARVDRLVVVDGMHVLVDYTGCNEVNYLWLPRRGSKRAFSAHKCCKELSPEAIKSQIRFRGLVYLLQRRWRSSRVQSMSSRYVFFFSAIPCLHPPHDSLMTIPVPTNSLPP